MSSFITSIVQTITHPPHSIALLVSLGALIHSNLSRPVWGRGVMGHMGQNGPTIGLFPDSLRGTILPATLSGLSLWFLLLGLVGRHRSRLSLSLFFGFHRPKKWISKHATAGELRTTTGRAASHGLASQNLRLPPIVGSKPFLGIISTIGTIGTIGTFSHYPELHPDQTFSTQTPHGNPCPYHPHHTTHTNHLDPSVSSRLHCSHLSTLL
jgi:hypothetical protein